MNFCWATLHVNDFEESLHFYHDIFGLPIDSRHGGDGLKIAMLGKEKETKIELLWSKDSHARPGGISIGIEVDSLEKTIKLLKEHNINIIRGPISPNPHVRFLFVNDPNGYEIQLVETK
ncbi:VOC family protein [Clostridium sp. Marseille-P299]|uniref:VOC family protein n=1 Tax=Clostridium sp. Marseille-P299 TaxID=1805477 RepID=UPI0008362D8A|nr:VOC family protein [Clostridium sp. Marseille-P299]